MPDVATRDLDAVADRSSPLLVRWMNALAEAEVSNDLDAKQAALDEISGIVARAMARADLSGRKVVRNRAIFAVSPLDAISENISEIVTRLYLERHGPSIAGVIDKKLTDRIRMAFAAGLPTASAVLQDISGWTTAYADTVYRTNLTTAYAAGQWQQALDPEMMEISPAFEYAATGDKDTRPNHQAMNGLLAGKADPIWNTYSTPNGYRCRCGLRDVDRFELNDRGLLKDDGSVTRVIPPNFARAHPDPGFDKGRPDQRVYGLLGR